MSPSEVHSNGRDLSRNSLGGAICFEGTSPERFKKTQSFQYVFNVAKIGRLDIVAYKTKQVTSVSKSDILNALMSHRLAVIGRRLMRNIQPSMSIHESAILQAACRSVAKVREVKKTYSRLQQRQGITPRDETAPSQPAACDLRAAAAGVSSHKVRLGS